ncbi:hypothetical protein GCM10008955_41570 [Deinococcus malanensis]|uniref:Uncharacterized protein n=1 Tax=Deinococcus malanensis TaxID=1706855 RepID=A0ABQ2F256_9DEIO|nr:hypothetical protein GCM10008955_41570 [Deinococcus malanensis]
MLTRTPELPYAFIQKAGPRQDITFHFDDTHPALSPDVRSGQLDRLRVVASKVEAPADPDGRSAPVVTRVRDPTRPH